MKMMKLVSIFALTLASGFAFAAPAGKIAVSAVSGSLVLVAADGSKKQAAVGDVFTENTTIVTDSKSSAKIVLANGTVLAVSPDTELEITQFEQNNPVAVEGMDYTTFTSEPEATSGSQTVVTLGQGTVTIKSVALLASSKMTIKTRVGDVLPTSSSTFSVADSGSMVSVGVVNGAVATVPTGRSSVKISSGKEVAIPISPSGLIGSPIYKGITPAQQAEIVAALDAADASSAADSSSATASNATAAAGDDSGIGVDPEVPAYADGSADGNPSRPTEENSPASI